MRANDIHPAQVAGMFYPAGPEAVKRLIAGERARARATSVTPKLVVAPHAGLVYSGAVAASAFEAWARQAEPPKRVVIFGPAHRYGFRGLALHPAASWSTPLGTAAIASDLFAKAAALPAVAVDARPFAGEHSLEMHLVMLQAMLPEPFEVLPVLVGGARPEEVAAVIAAVWGGPETVISISSDLSHFLDQARAAAIDGDTARRIETYDAAAMSGERACGFLPISGALQLADERDLRISALHLATSGDVTADRSRVVGYGAFAFEYAASARLADADRAKLLAAAFAALGAAARSGGRTPKLVFDFGPPPALTPMRATFVTLTHEGKLRGCIGSVAPQRRLVEDVVHNAVQAGFGDPRFSGLDASELAGLDIDISILSHPRPVPAGSESELAGALEPDRDGLILGAGGRRALFLPSVWRQVPEPRDFIRHLIAKAGLDPGRWPQGAHAHRYRVESFGAPWREVSAAELAPFRLAPAGTLH